MRQLFLKKGEVFLQEVPVPVLEDNNILVKVYYSFISSGTEISTLNLSEKSIVKKFAENSINNTKKVVENIKENGVLGTLALVKEKMNFINSLGYSCSGKVLAVGKSIEKFRVGDYVACAGSGFANHADVVSIPENLAVKLCEKLHTSSFIKIERLKRNFVDLFIPSFVRIGPICPNYPEQKTDISRVIGFVLFADLRGFSTWCMHAEPEQISEVYEVLSDTVAEYIKDYQFDYWKLLGDGIMLVWEAGQDETQAANCAIAAAYDLHRKYWYYYKESPFRLPEGFGIAISGGYITKFKSPTFFESCVVSDYLGPIVNQAARLQGLAKPGEVLVNRYVAKTSKYDWYSFENITVQLKDEIDGLKGLSPYEKEVFKVKHKYFGSAWETFITDPS